MSIGVTRHTWPQVARRIFGWALVAVLLGGATGISAQRWGRRRMPPRFPSGDPTHRLFTFTRGLYQSTHREQGGQGWYTDYPDADINFSTRLSELTRTPVGFDRHDGPDHIVVELTDPQLFNYPFLFMSDVGTVWFSSKEVERLGAYLRKGGFLWVDDFWGPFAWEQWAGAIGKVLPPGQFPIVDIPMSDPLAGWNARQPAGFGLRDSGYGRSCAREGLPVVSTGSTVCDHASLKPGA